MADEMKCECPARKALESLRRYAAVEGRPEGDKVLVGLAYDSHIWGPCADPKYEMYELAEAVEKWLHEKVDEALSAPCPCEPLRAELDRVKHDRDISDASAIRLLESNAEIRAELAASEKRRIDEWVKIANASGYQGPEDGTLEDHIRQIRVELAASVERERVLREALELFKGVAGRVAVSHKQFCECTLCLLAMGELPGAAIPEGTRE